MRADAAAIFAKMLPMPLMAYLLIISELFAATLMLMPPPLMMATLQR